MTMGLGPSRQNRITSGTLQTFTTQ